MHPLKERKSFFKGFKDAACGIYTVLKDERNFRVHICMIFYVLVFSIVGRVGMSNFLKFLICFAVVVAAELINSAIERICDRITEDYDERIKRIKDISAGAVLVAAVFSAILGLSVFLSKDVLVAIWENFTAYPYVPVLIFLSLPVSVLFIVKRGSK